MPGSMSGSRNRDARKRNARKRRGVSASEVVRAALYVGSVTTKRALIAGITGQDGSYLSELLLAKGYEVHGIVRRASTFNTERLEHLYRDPHETGVRMFLHYGDVGDAATRARRGGSSAGSRR